MDKYETYDDLILVHQASQLTDDSQVEPQISVAAILDPFWDGQTTTQNAS